MNILIIKNLSVMRSESKIKEIIKEQRVEDLLNSMKPSEISNLVKDNKMKPVATITGESDGLSAKISRSINSNNNN